MTRRDEIWNRENRSYYFRRGWWWAWGVILAVTVASPLVFILTAFLAGLVTSIGSLSF